MPIWIRGPSESFIHHVNLTPKEVEREGRIVVKDWDRCCPICGEPMSKTKRCYSCENPTCPLTHLRYNGKWIYDIVLAVISSSLKG